MRRAALLALALWAGPAQSGQLAASPEAHAFLGEELRALFRDEPDIIAKALAGPSPYADDIASDLALIARHAEALFGADRASYGPGDGSQPLAVLTAPSCADCVQTLAELYDLTRERPDLRITVIDLPASDSDARPALLAHVLRYAGFEAAQEARTILAGSPGLDAAGLAAELGRPRVAADPAQNSADLALFAALGLDLTPSYVLPEMMIRGALPAFLLTRYLD